MNFWVGVIRSFAAQVSKSSIARAQAQCLRAKISPCKSYFWTTARQGAVLRGGMAKGKADQKHIEKEHAEAADDPHQFQAGASTHRDVDQWKHREPYRIHEDGEGFDVKWEGGCHCGKIRYQLSRDKPLASKYCHCTTCQRLHGSPFQWAAIFHKGDINFTNGHHDLGWYDPTNKDTTHHLPCKVQCAFCRTPIMDEGRNMILLFPTLVDGINKKEARDAFKPTCHMFYTERVVDFNGDGIVKWKGLDNMSDLIDDNESVLVKFEKGMKSEDMDKKKRRILNDGDFEESQRKEKDLKIDGEKQ